MTEQKVSFKGLVKYMGKFYPTIAVDDISNPNCERTMDIFWNVCCYIYGEAKLIECMRGKEQRLALIYPLRSVFDKLLPSLKPGCTLNDLVFPTKERLVIFYTAIMNFNKVLDARSHVREQIHIEQEQQLARKENLQTAIVDAVEQTELAKAKKEKSSQYYYQLQDRFLTIQGLATQRAAKVADRQEELEKRKRLLSEENAKEAELRANLKSLGERIDYLELNTLPPKAEFEEKLKEHDSAVNHLEEQCREGHQKVNRLCKKAEQNAVDKTSATVAHTQLEETLCHTQKYREELSELEESIRSMERSLYDIKSQTLECEQQQTSQSEAMLAEKSALESRLVDLDRDHKEALIVRDDLSQDIGSRSQSVNSMENELKKIRSEKAAVQAEFDKFLESEKAATRHLEYLKAQLPKGGRSLGA